MSKQGQCLGNCGCLPCLGPPVHRRKVKSERNPLEKKLLLGRYMCGKGCNGFKVEGPWLVKVDLTVVGNGDMKDGRIAEKL